MQEPLKESPCYRRETKLVKDFFSETRRWLPGKSLSLSSHQLKELLSSHRFLFLKPIQTSTLMKNFSFLPSRLTGSKGKKGMNPSRPSKEGAAWESLIEESLPAQGTLAQKRVRGWRLKEFFLAKRELQRLKMHSFSPKSHTIEAYSETEGKNSSDWQELNHPNEERHFQITRITKILSD
ncbi:MAG: hypothetical protein A2Y28_03555 [Chlamydiae bacterium GWC2_50_10]|nr:MAG: hypothetical protein A2Y28_03555 [Chlamydiae bacterium GWC2_50_10]OGN56171.1 MAG: hypothetical protein A2098_03190 [Chlamydiae bacterium GWF2_49_8]OGN57728.1 MAG: hypothetical protein A3D18_04390 [Chlamydiae bacterium RIFCSPHIGHO2_02_FULL_49_29]OGN64312.1 MAG: hypothetical protein A3E26_00365 [Chlamydiae bacterium RIFCSPHIGHO2_12_FULL_49_32]OGN69320.1 MAG: hypothetical protein A3I15_03540 [Chlamydiae bacterium RIFCSPLOWO2_02_FULL_49_12]OGN75671.1 MAG: hypothetical protein A3G30_06030 [